MIDKKLICSLVSIAYCFNSYGIEKVKTPPNLIFVFPDEYRVQALGFMNEDPVHTPYLDKFAKEGIYFNNAVSNRPLSSPYRGMLLTGRYPWSTGLWKNCASISPGLELKKEEICFSDVLSENGYDCGYIGKWHLEEPKAGDIRFYEKRPDSSLWDAYTPLDRRHGFNFWYSYGCCDQHTRPHYWINDAAKDEEQVFDEYSPEHESNVAVEYILNANGKKRNPRKPFALFVSMNPPHFPYKDVPAKYLEYYKDLTDKELVYRPNVPQDHRLSREMARYYFAAVTAVDSAFGNILQALEEAGLEKNTIVVFTSDHGEYMGSHNLMGKGLIYEESFRIPLLIRYPGVLKPGMDDLHINVPDMMPTLLSLLGLKDKIPVQVDGSDYAPAILKKDVVRPKSTVFLTDSNIGGVRNDRFTYIKSGVLFDNIKDPYQLKNIANENPSIVLDMIRELEYWEGVKLKSKEKITSY